MTDIRAITFDVGGTLIEPWPSVGQVYASVASRFGIGNLSPETLTAAFLRFWKARDSFDYSNESWQSIVKTTFGNALPTSSFQEVFTAIYDEFSLAHTWRIYEDVLPALNDLENAGFRLGIISNWDERLRPLLQTLGLSHHFEPIIISHEIGAAKPHPRLFRAAADGFSLEPDQILHVGDSHREDVSGAHRAGFRAVHLRRGNQNCKWPDLDSLFNLLPSLEKNKQPPT